MKQEMRKMLMNAFIGCFERETGTSITYNEKKDIMSYRDLKGKKFSGKYTQEMKEHMQQIISDAVFQEIKANKYGGQA